MIFRRLPADSRAYVAAAVWALLAFSSAQQASAQLQQSPEEAPPAHEAAPDPQAQQNSALNPSDPAQVNAERNCLRFR